MKKAMLIEQTAKQTKKAEAIVLLMLFGSIAIGLGLYYVWEPAGFAMFCVTGLAFVAFCCVRVWRWWVNG